MKLYENTDKGLQSIPCASRETGGAAGAFPRHLPGLCINSLLHQWTSSAPSPCCATRKRVPTASSTYRRGQPVADPNSMSSTTVPVWLRFCHPNCSGQPPASPYGPLSRVVKRSQDGAFVVSDKRERILGLRQTYTQVSLNSTLPPPEEFR